MNIKVNNLSSGQVEILFSVPVLEIQPYIERTLKQLGQEIKIDGYRPGKIPDNILKERLDEMKVLEEAATLIIKEAYPKAILDNNIEAIDRPEITITKIAPQNDLEFNAKVNILPPIVLPKDCKKIAQEAIKDSKIPSIEEKDVTDALDWLQKSRAQLKEITRPAKTGDAVEIDFETKFNGISVEHGSAKNYLFILGEGKFLPGFEEQIINETADAVKEFTLTAPENWPYENMRGQTLNFKITINKIQERILPEINDQFAKSLGNFENLEKLKNSIETGVLQEKEEKTKSENRMNIIEALLKQTKIEIPDSLIVHETDKMIDELKMTSEEAGLSFEDYLLQIKKTEAEIRIGFKEQAEKRIKSALMLKQIGISQEIPVSDEEIQEETKKIVEKARQEGHKGEFDSENLKEYIKGALRNEKVFAFLENKEK